MAHNINTITEITDLIHTDIIHITQDDPLSSFPALNQMAWDNLKL